MKTIYIFERGILGWQSIFGDWVNWPNQAIVWIHKNTLHKAQTLTYFTGFIFPALTRKRRAKNFAKLLKSYQSGEWRTVLVAHSEGTATGLLAWKLAGYPFIDELHLVCGACDSNFKTNGINHAVALSRVGRIFVYVADKDKAMRLEDSYLGSICFGLECRGTPLGLNGPVNASIAAQQIMVVRHWPSFGHSQCWNASRFEETMREIVFTN